MLFLFVSYWLRVDTFFLLESGRVKGRLSASGSLWKCKPLVARELVWCGIRIGLGRCGFERLMAMALSYLSGRPLRYDPEMLILTGLRRC